MTNPFEPGPSEWTGPAVDDDMVRRAEETLGYRLPRAYVDLLRRQNGGVLEENCHPTTFRTSWAADHFQMDVLLGIGYPEGADTQSRELIEEWDYPPDGVVIGVTALAGPDTVMLDYSAGGPQGEPTVVYVGSDRVKHQIANTFADFITGFVPAEEYEED
ncbi:SMI1/KNR4 family protein [Actinoplanes sp. NPDC049596]|uniref:SMI1/KNR4 family protein n=1 Tax=unclassified Actinoplanes TaxID=2626549 RepID=UPI003439EE40